MPPKKSKTPRKLTPKQINAMLKKLITSHKLNEKRIKQLLEIQGYNYDSDSECEYEVQPQRKYSKQSDDDDDNDDTWSVMSD